MLLTLKLTAGMKSGDVVVKIGDRSIEDQGDMLQTVAGMAPGKKVAVTVVRQGKEKTLDVELAERPKQSKQEQPE